MTPKRIVITGGPGSGKTTLIELLEAKGFPVIHEISRQVIQEAQAAGIDQLFLTDPLLFSQKLMDGRLKQFEQAKDHSEKHLFYDRGLPDVTSYMHYIEAKYPATFDAPCFNNCYDQVFLLPPWKSIYTQDNERYESFEQAETIHDHLLKGYEKYGYNVQLVPVGTPSERIDHILEKLEILF